MGNCCDFIESGVRDKHNQPQQGMVWVKNNKKQHNIFKDRNEVPLRIIRNDSNMSLTRALKYETQHQTPQLTIIKGKSAANIFEQYKNQNGDNLTFAPNSESRRREFDRSIEEDGLAINVSFNGQMQDVKSYDRDIRSDQGGGVADHVGIFIEHSTSKASFNQEIKCTDQSRLIESQHIESRYIINDLLANKIPSPRKFRFNPINQEQLPQKNQTQIKALPWGPCRISILARQLNKQVQQVLPTSKSETEKCKFEVQVVNRTIQMTRMI
eukprot:403360007